MANRDHVSPPVLGGAGVGLAVAAGARYLLGQQVDAAEAQTWVDFTTTVILPGLVAAGAFLGARFRARNRVTPITPDATPTDLQGRLLVPAAGESQADPFTPPRRPRKPIE